MLEKNRKRDLAELQCQREREIHQSFNSRERERFSKASMPWKESGEGFSRRGREKTP
jgi:hypothetical protein